MQIPALGAGRLGGLCALDRRRSFSIGGHTQDSKTLVGSVEVVICPSTLEPTCRFLLSALGGLVGFALDQQFRLPDDPNGEVTLQSPLSNEYSTYEDIQSRLDFCIGFQVKGDQKSRLLFPGRPHRRGHPPVSTEVGSNSGLKACILVRTTLL